MAKTTTKTEPSQGTKKTKSIVGAPSQLSQNTRKGKKAWRKNIDIDNVEDGLETIRSEERVLGTALHNQSDKDLFAIDLTGDGGGAVPVGCLKHAQQADHLGRSQAETTKVLKGSIDFHENPISKIRRSCCQLTGCEEISSWLPAEGKVVTDNSTYTSWAIQRDHRPYRVWSRQCPDRYFRGSEEERQI